MTIFKRGDRVGLNVSYISTDDWSDPIKSTYKIAENNKEAPCFGMIESLTNEHAIVKWDNDRSYILENLFQENEFDDESCLLSDLMPEADMKVLVSELETTFNEVKVQVQEKLKMACDLIREAQKVAASHNQSASDFASIYSLFPAMNEAGWNTSSFGC